MQLTEINSNGLKHDFKIVVSSNDIAQRVNTRLDEIAKTVKIPGFRPGKIPPKILRQRYGEAVSGEILESLVNESIGSVLSERKLFPAIQPKVDVTSYEDGSDLEFSVEVEVLPEVTSMDLSTLKLERIFAKSLEKDIDEAIENIASHQEKTSPVKRASQLGDVVLIDFLGKINGVPFDGGAANSYSLKLGSESFIPGFEGQLVGKKAKDVIIVKVVFPDTYGNAELAGKDAEFDVTVHQVLKASPSEIDDELAKKLGMEDVPALREAIRGELDRNLDTMSRMSIKRKVLDALAEAHDFEVPVSLVDQEFGRIWAELEREKAQGNVDPEDEGKDEDVLKSEYRFLAERRVRLGLLMSHIGKSNNIGLTQDDINGAVIREASRFPGQEQKVFEYFQNNPQAMEVLRAPIFEEKVVDFILEKAQLTEKEVSVAELKADDGSLDVEKVIKSEVKKTAKKKKPAVEGDTSSEKKPAKKAVAVKPKKDSAAKTKKDSE